MLPKFQNYNRIWVRFCQNYYIFLYFFLFLEDVLKVISKNYNQNIESCMSALDNLEARGIESRKRKRDEKTPPRKIKSKKRLFPTLIKTNDFIDAEAVEG